jgi:hypothetical protein
VGGRAVKGPLGEMSPQLTGARASAAAVCAHYAKRWDGLLHGFVVERGDEGEIPNVADVRVLATDTIMSDRAASERLAREVLALGERLR